MVITDVSPHAKYPLVVRYSSQQLSGAEGLSERQKREVGAAPLGNQSEFLDGLSVYIGIMWLVFKPILMLAAIALAARAWQSSARVPVLMIWALLLYNAAVVSVFAEAQARYVHLGIALMLLAAFASYAAGRCRSSS